MKLTQGVTRVELPNGLTILVKENHTAPVVAIYSYVKAGYFNEPDRLVGISHLVEHMFFKGTQKRGVGEIAQETKSLGGFLNASTIYDHTLYYTVLPARNFREGMDIQADALQNSLFDPKELRKETEVVIQEAKKKLDNPSAFATEKMFELAFEKHRIRRWRIGTEEGLRSLTRDDFLVFYENLYRPENIILVIVGDIKTAEVLEEAQKRYAEFQRGCLKKTESPPEPPQNQFNYAFFKGDIQQSYLRLGFHTREILHRDTYAFEILAFILGVGRSSRLFQTVREQKRLVQSVSAYNYSLENLGIFVLNAIARPDNLREAVFSIFAELAKLRDKPIPADELSKAKTILESIYVYNLETTSGQANNLASYEAIGDYHLADTTVQALYDVTAEDIRRVAQKYLTFANCSLLEYVPESSSLQQCDIGDFEQWVKEKLSTGKVDSRPQARKKPKKQVFPTHVSTDGVEKGVVRTVLPNGLTLLVKESRQIPTVSIGVFAKGGRSRETSEISGLTGLTARTLLKGTRNREASQIALEIESLGSSISFSNAPDYLGCTMKILAKNLRAGWNILTDVLINPVFPEHELEKEKENAIAQIRQSRDDMFGCPLQLFYSALFNGHAYGLPANGELTTVESLAREHLQDWHARHFLPENLVVSVVGDVDLKRIQELVEEKFCRRGSDGIRAEDENLYPSPNHESRIETRDKNQTALVVGFTGPEYGSEDYYPLLLLQNAISGLGGRFFEELRGRQGLAYSISAHLVSRLVGGAFLAYIATSPENEEVAIKGLLREFEKVIEEPVSGKELYQSTQYTIGIHQIGLETYGSQMVQYAHNELLGRGYEEVARFAERIKSITPEDILQAARRYIDLDHFATGMVRGKLN